MKTDYSLEDFLAECRLRTESTLTSVLPSIHVNPERLHEAMHYATLNGGKRVRPVLAYAAARCLGQDLAKVDIPACAVELIHCYSLVHDDLPSMDDDDLRRGKPTCHKAYDEATALLVGDALQTLAFQILTDPKHDQLDANTRLAMSHRLATASGSRGMAGGQSIDLDSVGKSLDLVQLENMHIHKTGALIRASVLMGAMVADEIEPDTLQRLDHYAKCIGLAFQIRDDLLDVESDTETLGKPQGSDADQDKPTYTSLMGLEGAREKAQDLHEEAIKALEPFGEAARELRWISEYIIQRTS